ncbi:tetratricopeptide repeat protein [Calothrix sp. CCY 0018]|uniref:tetratricopeptide repeat protein n=1 Tax=Calothrix sp. CCY 0018 TaxID=3103864 RepID=UPI0039C73559
MLGNILNKRYHIIQKLGEGGFGETYLAQDGWQEGDNRCVVKRLKPDLINPTILKLFKGEAKSLTLLGSHDQIPQLLAHFQQEQEIYLVQEFIDGHDLTKEIIDGEPWKETRVIKLLKDILKILEFVHENKVIHRDIKPANIMRRNQDNKIVLIDFGGVKQVKTQTGSTLLTGVIGTPGYTPQEQFDNNAQLCSDVYAVGMLAIQALTGYDPANVPTDSTTFQPIWRDKVEVNKRFADVLDRMVRFDFVERYQSAGEALEALKNLSLTASDWYNKGENLYRLQRYTEAIVAFKQALEIQPEYYLAWKFKGLAHNKLANYTEAITSFEKAIELQNDCFEIWYSHAWGLFQLKRYSEAVKSFDRAIDIEKNDFKTWYYRGLALEELDKYSEAIISFEESIKIQPDSYPALYNCAYLLQELGRYEEALEFFDRAIEIKTDDLEAWYNRGSVSYQLGKYRTAFASFDRAIKIKSDDSDIWYSRGLALMKLREYNEAIVSFDEAIEIKPDDYQAWFNRALTLSKRRKYTEAIFTYNKALTIKPDFQEALENRNAIRKKDTPFLKAFTVGGIWLLFKTLVMLPYGLVYNKNWLMSTGFFLSIVMFILASTITGLIARFGRATDIRYSWVKIIFLDLLVKLIIIIYLISVIARN